MSMDIEHNPLELSLDELIALNKSKYEVEEKREQQSLTDCAESKQSHKWFAPKHKKNGIKSENVILPNEALKINDRLRNLPGFGSNPIHTRLGYFHVYKKNRNVGPRSASVQRAVKKARYLNWIKSQPAANPLIIFQNPNAINRPCLSQLTTSAVSKFNEANNNGFKRCISNGSVRTFLSQRPTILRHSIKKSLDPSIQRIIQNLIVQDTASSFHLDSLEDFRASPQGTITPIHERFSKYL